MKSRPAFRNDNAEPAAHCGLRVVVKSKKRQERTAIMEYRQYIVTMAVETVGARCEQVDGKAPEKTRLAHSKSFARALASNKSLMWGICTADLPGCRE